MDACLTTALTEITLAAGSYVSYAGAANILYYDSSTGVTYNLDAGWNKPYYLDPAQIPEHHSELGNGAAVLVPGLIAGVYTASERFGLFPLSKLLEPALYFATRGFKLPSDLAEEMRKNYNQRGLLRTKEGKYTFTNPKTRKVYKAGERFRQLKLGKFLKRLSRYGKEYFYRGPWAEEMVETVQRHEGYVTMEDMTQYKVTSPEPTSTLYQKHHVVTTGAELGGAELVEKLNLMQLAGIGGSTDSYLTNATKLFWLASITRLSSFVTFFAQEVPDGKQLLKDHLGINADYSYRKTKDSAEELWDKIASFEKMRNVNDVMRELLASVEMDVERHHRGSSGVVAVDGAGNVCSLSHGTDSDAWGTGLFVHGVSLPSSGIALKAQVKRTNSGKRIPSGFQPVIIFEKETRQLDEFGRRLRRDISAARKNRKSLASKRKGFSNHQSNWEEEPQKLVVFKTYNSVRSQFFHQSQRDKSEKRHQLGREEELADKFEEKEYPDVHSNFQADGMPFNEPSHERERTNLPTEVSGKLKSAMHSEPSILPTEEHEEFNVEKSHRHINKEANGESRLKSHTEPSIPPTEELEEFEKPHDPDLYRHKNTEVNDESKLPMHPEPPMLPTEELEEVEKPHPESHLHYHNEEESSNVSPSSVIIQEKEEREENEKEAEEREESKREESEREEEIIVRRQKTEGKDSQEKNIFNKEEVKEFPHLGIPDVWRSGSLLDREATSMLHSIPLVPVLALTSTGPSQSFVIPQYLTSILDSGLNPKVALEAPTFLSPSPHSFQQDIQVEKFTIEDHVLLDVTEFGQPVSEVDSQTTEELAGNGAALTVKDGRKMLGCAHPSKTGFAEGVSVLEGW